MVDQFKEAFKEETSDIIASLNNLLVDLEVDSSNEENKILLFRHLHTIKGGAGMFGYNKMASLVHDIETVLDPYKQGAVSHISPEVTSLLLNCMDYLSFLMGTDEGQSDDFEQKKIALISFLSHAFEGEEALENLSQNKPLASEVKEESVGFLLDESLGSPEGVNFYRIDILLSEDFLFTGNRPHFLFNDLSELGDLKSFANTVRIPLLSELDTGKLYINWIVILASLAEKELVEDVFLFLMGDSKAIVQNLSLENSLFIEETIDDIVKFGFRKAEVREILSSSDLLKSLVKENTLSSPSLVEDLHEKVDFIEEKDLPKVELTSSPIPLKETPPSSSALPVTSSAPAGGSAGVAVQRIRVDSRRLDNLVDLVGELVTIQARLSQKLKEGNYNEMENIAEKLDFIVQELRDITTGMRMIPIQGTFVKFQRLVRDLSQELGKKVNYITEGGDTEIDKNIIEKLDEPLVHLIRNSLDHGIESPEERIAEGKPETAFVKISAQQNGANISIVIQDDGAGINRDAVGKKAVERGLVSSYEDLNDEEVYNFIFAPGFSTASQVTNLSGRGVGLNVVKSQVESLRGNIHVKSEVGKGTTFSLVFPLTLAIIDGFLIRVGLEYFIIPLVNVDACLEMKTADFQKQKTEQGGFMAFREKVIPFIELRDLFEIKEELPESQQVVIVQADHSMIGIFVDEVIGKHQTVIKSLGEIYRNAKGVSSATILGDGSIALLLDVEAIVDMYATTADLAKEITLEELKAFTQEINLGGVSLD